MFELEQIDGEKENKKARYLKEVIEEELEIEEQKMCYLLLSSSPQKFLSSILGLEKNKFVYRKERVFKFIRSRISMKIFREENLSFDDLLKEILTKKQLFFLGKLERHQSIPSFCRRHSLKLSTSYWRLRLRILKRLSKASKKSSLVKEYFSLLKSFWHGKQISSV